MLGMKNHFDISGSIEIREIDIAGVACRYIEHVNKEVYCQKIDCLSNLAILYGLCILDSSFLYWSLLRGGYLISFAYYPFFSFGQTQ